MDYKLIIFDADGTLRYCTVEGQPCPNKEDEWKLYPGVSEKLSSFNWASPQDKQGIGYGIASNQGGVGSGYFTEEMAKKLLVNTFEEAFGFTPAEGTVEMCIHVPYSGCSCRKPEPEMINNIKNLYGVTPKEILFVGDRDADKNAAANAGCDFMWAYEFFGREPEE